MATLFLWGSVWIYPLSGGPWFYPQFNTLGRGELHSPVEHLNQDGKDERMDQDLDLNQDGKDERMGQDHDMNQDEKDERMDQESKWPYLSLESTSDNIF